MSAEGIAQRRVDFGLTEPTPLTYYPEPLNICSHPDEEAFHFWYDYEVDITVLCNATQFELLTWFNNERQQIWDKGGHYPIVHEKIHTAPRASSFSRALRAVYRFFIS